MAELLGIDGPGMPPSDGPTPGPEPGPQPQPQPGPQFREVELQPNETISHLSQRHLGTMRRYREILELNGWSEQQSRRLTVGTVVRLPLQ